MSVSCRPLTLWIFTPLIRLFALSSSIAQYRYIGCLLAAFSPYTTPLALAPDASPTPSSSQIASKKLAPPPSSSHKSCKALPRTRSYTTTSCANSLNAAPLRPAPCKATWPPRTPAPTTTSWSRLSTPMNSYSRRLTCISVRCFTQGSSMDQALLLGKTYL